MPQKEQRKGPSSMGPKTAALLEVKSAKTLKFWQAVISEFLGTMILMFAQSMLPLNMGVGASDLVRTGLGMGFVVFILIQTIGPIGGAHMNPAVTVAMLSHGEISLLKGFLYVVAQITGGLCGTGLVWVATPEGLRETLAATTLHPQVTVGAGVLVEICISFILIIVIWGSTDNRLTKPELPGLAIGMAVTLDILATGNHTGASINPARSLAPAIIVGDPRLWTHHWVFWVGPISGGLLATVVYHWILTLKVAKKVAPEEDEKCCSELLSELRDILSHQDRIMAFRNPSTSSGELSSPTLMEEKL